MVSARRVDRPARHTRLPERLTMALAPLSKPKGRKPYAVYDIETTTDLKNVYLVGYFDGADYRYWESTPLPPEDPRSAMGQFMEWYLSEPRKQWLYAHNGGNFDTVFALAYLLKNRPDLGVQLIPSQSSILMMEVLHHGGNNKWLFLDSARTLPDSLDNLGKCFVGKSKIEVKDYATLHLDPDRYRYLEQDCRLLYDVLEEYFNLLYDKLKGQAGVSAASTALKTYRTSYQDKVLPGIEPETAAFVRLGYYGGRCEPFRKEFRSRNGSILHCYDVNSLYPWAMRQPQPYRFLWQSTRKVKGVAGFVDATVSVKPCHIPVLPCRADGKLLFPTGTFRGVFSTVELALAEQHGQLSSLQIHNGHYFDTADLFSAYIDTMFAYRDKSKPDWKLSLDRLAKLMPNSTYGKFGSNELRETIHVRPSFEDITQLQLQQIQSPVTTQVWLQRTETQADYMLPQISAWVTALGRVRLGTKLLELGREVFYGDTDSVFTTVETACGTSLGEWKDEYAKDPIVYAYFLAPKVYVLRHASGKVTNKAKGFSRFADTLPKDAVQCLREGKDIEVSRFAKMRSVIRGDFGLVVQRKRCHLDYEKRIFRQDGTSYPRRIP